MKVEYGAWRTRLYFNRLLWEVSENSLLLHRMYGSLSWRLRAGSLWWRVIDREKKALFSLLWDVCLNQSFSSEKPLSPDRNPGGPG